MSDERYKRSATVVNKILEPALRTRDVPVPQHRERGRGGTLKNKEIGMEIHQFGGDFT